jgi:glycosyltransferase involved in cell wall biosynthesis
VSVIVPARDAARTLPLTLAALAAQRGAPPHEVIVVDDGSSDGTADVVRDPVRLVQTAGVGSGEARNRGVAAAHGRILAFTDADCFPAPGWLAAGLRCLATAELVCGAVMPDPDAALGPFDRTLWVGCETGLYETANLFVTRDAFERAGGFEPWLSDTGPPLRSTNPELGEDVWLGWRVRRAGGRSAFCPEALVHHAVHPRGAADYVRERRRLRHFPALAARVPELREHLFYRRLFLTSRSAAFDAALAGTAVAAIRRSPAPLAAGIPYALLVARRARRRGRAAPLIAAVDVVADGVGLAALLAGSVATRSAVL